LQIFLDKRDNTEFDLLTVSETSAEPPQVQHSFFTYISVQMFTAMCARNHGGKERMERLTTNDIYKVDGVSREKGVLVGDGWDEADKQKKNKFQLYVRDCTPVFATSAPHPTTFG
jgi:hypothetical protein